ncbi:unnamed protein product, partial [Nesidiocoris tenuis]
MKLNVTRWQAILKISLMTNYSHRAQRMKYVYQVYQSWRWSVSSLSSLFLVQDAHHRKGTDQRFPHEQQTISGENREGRGRTLRGDQWEG